eukprot:TRINITY_DN4174_c0_g1_i1.p2 TRINITY_DN4174_c0_g1~~TRINITY_DN4174_c0_g1_i1.p2  ORF type:complete len:319 (+),score=42.54 TRINITY_DN4174_c0_g1_i1:102-1058(+)
MTTSLTILVTGGAGFIGFTMVTRLLSEGHKVVVLDNLQTGQEEHVKEWESHKNFTFVRQDVIESYLPTQFKFDQIYHMACPASPPLYQMDPIHTAKTNFMGTLNMLELARRDNARMLICSTSEVYGDPDLDHHPQTEDYRGNVSCTGPRACYDEGKRISETLCFDYIRKYKTNVVVARIFNTYGPNMNPEDGRVVSNFIMQALRGEDLTIYGDGSQTRSFCFVTDTVDGLIRLMSAKQEVTGPINIGNPVERTIKQLAETIISTVGNDITLTFKDLPKDDPLQRKPNITKAWEVLQWKPKVDFKDGLAKTIVYFKTKC